MDFSLFLMIGFFLALMSAVYPVVVTLISIITFWLIIFFVNLLNLNIFKNPLIDWSHYLSFQFSFNFDSVTKIFLVLISGISLFVFIYGYQYFIDNKHKRSKLVSLLQAFGVSMVGAVTSDNMIILFLFWEMTTLISYLLIQFDYQEEKSNQLAFNAMLLSVVGGFCLLVAIVLLQINTHSMSLHLALTLVGKNNHLLITLFILLLIASMAKSAQFPFHFWLPGAMKAPTPVSAYLHSATMVNLGLYLLARFHSLFQSHSYWYFTLTTVGLVTMLISAIISMIKNDLKKILAYTTIFSLGLMIYLLGSSEWVAIEAMIVFLIFHGIYKSGLFMLVGAIDKQYGMRDIKMIAGIARGNKLIAFNSIVLFCAMAGLPPFFGFAMKEMLFEAKLASGSISLIMMTLGVIASALLAAASFRCLFYLFQPRSLVLQSKNHAKLLMIMPTIMSIFILIMWLIEVHLSVLISDAADIILNMDYLYEYSISLKSTLLSLGTFLAGVGLFFVYLYSRNSLIKIKLHLFDGNEVLRFLVHRFITTWQLLTDWLEKLSIDQKCKIILLCSVLSLFSFHYASLLALPNFYLFDRLPVVIISLVVLIGSVFIVIRSKDIILDVVSLAVFGLFLCALYLYLGAPDVSMTQFLIEILSVVIISLVFRKEILVAKYAGSKNTLSRIALSCGFGVLIFLIILSFWGVNQPQEVLNYYELHSLKSAYGKNIVNVILVDFRSFDTLGEALVVLGAMIGVFAYMKRAKSEDKL